MRRSLSTVMSAARVRGVVAAASYQVHARGLSIAPASQSSGRQPKKTGPSVLEMFEEASRSKKEAKLAISQSEGFHPEVSATNPAKPKTELENFHDSLEQGDFAKIKKHLASPNIPKIINARGEYGRSALSIILREASEQNREYPLYDEVGQKPVTRTDFSGKKDYPESWRRINQRDSALDALGVLLKNGADPNLPLGGYVLEESPLKNALDSGVLGSVDLLLRYGARLANQELIYTLSNRPDLGLLKRIFEKNGTDPNQADEYGVTPLIRAIECCQSRIVEDEVREIDKKRHKSDLGLVELLLKMGADPEKSWDLIKFKEIINNLDITLKEVKSQIPKGMDYDILKDNIKYLSKRNKGRAAETPIELAQNKGLDDVVKVLQESIDAKKTYAKIEISVKPEALHRAVESGNYEMVETLLELGADPHEPSQDDGLENHKVQHERNKGAMASQGYVAGPYSGAIGGNNNPPPGSVQKAQKRFISSGSFAENRRRDRKRLDNAAALHYSDPEGLNSLEQKLGLSPQEFLGHAVKLSSVAAVGNLMSRGSYRKLVNEELESKKTPLEISAAFGRTCIDITYLLVKNADPPLDLESKNGRKVLSELVKGGESQIIEVALTRFGENGGDSKSIGDDILFDIVNKGVYYDTATHLLQGGLASIHAVNIEGESILFKIIDVAKSGEPEDRDCYYEELLSRVIDGFEIEGYNCDGEYPLNRAIEKNNKFALDLLLEKGVNPNTLSKNGDTPLAHFIKEEDLGTVELLLEYGADPNLLDGSGKLPLLVAMDIENESDQIKFVDMLIKHGADIDLLPSITPPGNSPKPNVEGIDLDNPILSRDSEKSNGRGE